MILMKTQQSKVIGLFNLIRMENRDEDLLQGKSRRTFLERLIKWTPRKLWLMKCIEKCHKNHRLVCNRFFHHHWSYEHPRLRLMKNLSLLIAFWHRKNHRSVLSNLMSRVFNWLTLMMLLAFTPNLQLHLSCTTIWNEITWSSKRRYFDFRNFWWIPRSWYPITLRGKGSCNEWLQILKWKNSCLVRTI